MKPSGSLSRTTGLQRRTRLVSNPKTAREWRDRSQRNAAARRCSKPAVPASTAKKPRKKTSSRAGESTARKLVYARSGGWCEVQLPGICLGPGMNWHHILDRKHGGPWAAWNGMHVCGSGAPGHGCHGTLTTPPPGRLAEFETAGWIAQSGRSPRGVKVSVPRRLVHPDDQDCPDDARVLVLLTPDGRYEPVGEGSC